MLTELIVGRTIDECRELTTDDLIAALDGVPPDKLHCPRCDGSLQDALRKTRSSNEPGELRRDEQPERWRGETR